MVSQSLVFFYIAAALVVMGGLGVVLTRNIVYAAFALLAAMLGVAGVFLLMFAEFLALVQVLIYGGAVVIVVLFSLMLTRIQDFENLTDHRQWPLAALFAIGVFALLVAATLTTSVRVVERESVGFRALGESLFTDWAVPFEVASLVLLGRPNRINRPSQDNRWPRLIELAHLQVLAAALFSIGLYGVLARRSAVLILMSIELMLNAVNINLIGYRDFRRLRRGTARARSGVDHLRDYCCRR